MEALLAVWKFTNNLGWLNDVYSVLPDILYGILAVVGGAGTVYSIVLGVNLAKSENDEKRRYAVYRLRNTIIGLVCLIVLVVFVNLALPAILKAAFPNDWIEVEETQTPSQNPSETPETGAIGLFKTYSPFIKFILTKY